MHTASRFFRPWRLPGYAFSPAPYAEERAMSLAHYTPIAFILTRHRKTAEDFYREKLGLNFVADDGFAAVFDLDGASLRITEIPDYQPGPHPVLGWKVDDIEAEVRALTDRGIVFTIYEGLGQDASGIWTAPDGSAKVAFFSDPDGNGLSLTQVMRPD
jgi:catechol 2,3-dioxygenase-like lactoylglutathione lyase family enzyme